MSPECPCRTKGQWLPAGPALNCSGLLTLPDWAPWGQGRHGTGCTKPSTAGLRGGAVSAGVAQSGGAERTAGGETDKARVQTPAQRAQAQGDSIGAMAQPEPCPGRGTSTVGVQGGLKASDTGCCHCQGPARIVQGRWRTQMRLFGGRVPGEGPGQSQAAMAWQHRRRLRPCALSSSAVRGAPVSLGAPAVSSGSREGEASTSDHAYEIHACVCPCTRGPIYMSMHNCVCV